MYILLTLLFHNQIYFTDTKYTILSYTNYYSSSCKTENIVYVYIFILTSIFYLSLYPIKKTLHAKQAYTSSIIFKI